MPNYEVVFMVGDNIVSNIEVTAKDEKEATKIASQSFKVGVKKSYKLGDKNA